MPKSGPRAERMPWVSGRKGFRGPLARAPPQKRGLFGDSLGLAFAEDDPATFKVVGGQLYVDLVSRNNTDEVLPHLPCDDGQYFVAVIELNPKLCVR